MLGLSLTHKNDNSTRNLRQIAKGVKMDIGHYTKGKQQMFWGLVLFPLYLPVFPLSSFRTVGSRIGELWGKTLARLSMFGFIGIVIWAFYMTLSKSQAPENMWIYVMVFFFGLVLVLLPWMFIVQYDNEWAQIDEYEKHRRVHVWKIENVICLSALSITLIQLIALILDILPELPDVESRSDYEQMKADFIAVMDFFLMRFGLQFWELSFWLIVCCVLFWSAFAGIGTKIANFAKKSTGTAKWLSVAKILKVITCGKYERPSTPYADRIAIRMAIYDMLGNRMMFRYVFVLLSDVLFLPILTNLFSILDCSFQNSTGVVSLDIDPYELIDGEADGTICWTDYHRSLALVSTICILIYVPTCLMMAAFWVADSDGAFISPDLDIRFSPIFNLRERFCRMLIAASVTFVGGNNPVIALTLSFILNGYLAYLCEKMKPCCVLWINAFRSAIFSMASLTSLCLMLDIIDIEWFPFILMWFIWFVIILFVIWRTFKVMRMGTPAFEKEEEAGPTHDDTEEFDDSSLLRGFQHSIEKITLWQTDEFQGFQCFYRMDRFSVTGPRHLGLVGRQGMTARTYELKPNEYITKLTGTRAGKNNGFINKLVFHTSAGRSFEAGSSADGLIFNLDPRHGRIVAFHGGIGSRLHNVGLITQSEEDVARYVVKSEHRVSRVHQHVQRYENKTVKREERHNKNRPSIMKL